LPANKSERVEIAEVQPLIPTPIPPHASRVSLFVFCSAFLPPKPRVAARGEFALRHQIDTLRWGGHRPLRLSSAGRVLWVWLLCLWGSWRSPLVIVKPETVVRCHRKDFRLYWTWKSRCACLGRPDIPQEVRDLIGKMSMWNPLWGAPRIHGNYSSRGLNFRKRRWPTTWSAEGSRLRRVGLPY